MSGFAGIVRIAPSSATDEADRTAIEGMAGAIAFRGPDSLQKTQQPGASFAFSLLTTGPAPQETSQPCTVDGETWFLGDARCDGRDELRRKLAQHGVELPASASSEQLVLHYYAKFGEAGLPELDGDFSFVLWDSRARKIVAYRDLTGSRPFFYAHRERALVFSNTLQAVLAVPSISRELDEEFLADFLLGYPYQNPSATAYGEIRRLPPGHVLVFSEVGLAIRRIANMPLDDVLVFKRDDDYVEEFRRLLEQSVRDQLPSTGTTILLSGGLDSTTLAARAVSQRKQASPGANLNLRALCVDSRPLIDDPESALATRLAESLGIPCEFLHTGEWLPFDGWEDAQNPLPEPVLNPYAKLSFSIYRMIARNSRVVLSGDGGDEVLRLQAWPYLKFLYKRHGPLSVISTVSRYLVSRRKLPALGAGIRSGFLRLLGKKSYQLSLPSWFTPDFEQRLDLPGRWRAMNSPAPSPHPFNPRAYASLNDPFVASAMEFTDATWSGCAVESRAPFLDRRLSRFLLRIPPIPWAMEKDLLRRSQFGILPDEIRLRPKTPVIQDVLLLVAASRKWNPAVTGPVPELLHSLVDWPRLTRLLQSSVDESLYMHLRPLALARWLKVVENRG